MAVTYSGETVGHPLPEAGSVQHASDIAPDSILWHVAGDKRVNFAVLSIALRQVMIPPVGAGVQYHSNVFEDPLDRIERSGDQIATAIYGPNAEAMAQHIKKLHNKYRGIDEHGRPYNALNPRTFGSTHASFLKLYEDTIDRFTPWEFPMNAREQLHDEMSALFLRYGYKHLLTPHYYAYQDWWYRIEQAFEMTPAAERGIDLALSGNIKRPRSISPEIWTLGGRIAGKEFVRLTSIGGLSDDVRKRFGIPWPLTDRLMLGAMETLVKTFGDLIPPEKRYMPIAYKALKQAGVKLY